MKNFILKSMGCKSNQFEGQIVAEKLVEAGYKEVHKLDEAEIYILNSCSVTHKSDNEAFYLLRHAHSLGLKTVLTGCIAQIEKSKLLKEDFIDYVFGNEDKFHLPKLLEEEREYAVKDLMTSDKFYPAILNDTTKTRISLKIQDGCDNRCSYCVIPFGRGKSRSAEAEFIVNEINRYSKIGYKEVVLTGIHIGQWGSERKMSILNLLQDIEHKTTIHRYRLGSLNPLEITQDLLNFLEKSEKFCPHFHLSLQSACNNTLKRMNRHYTVEAYLDQIQDIYERFKNAYIGSDIITGFAGETDDDFEVTVENILKSKLSKIHVFPYSVRKGTLAEKLSGHLPDSVKEQRADIIKKISQDKFAEFIHNNIGTVQEVLIEKHKDKHTDKFKGVTRNYLNVLLDDGEFNTLKNVMLTKENLLYK